jgi:hypothetical protein
VRALVGFGANPLVMRLLLALTISIVACTSLPAADHSRVSAPNAHNNAIHVIFPYLHEGQWVFDDDRFGLTREPFVLGADEVVGLLADTVTKSGNKRFKLIFSAQPFPNPTMVADRVGEWSHAGGANYETRPDKRPLWLCPAMFHYFANAPESIYARAEKAE